MKGWSLHLADELHKPVTWKLKKREVKSNGIDGIWSVYLIEMGKFSKQNRGIK